MAISTDKVDFDIRREEPVQHGDATRHTWVGTWRYPVGESEDEWLEALRERLNADRIVEDHYDYTRHNFHADVDHGAVTVFVNVLVPLEEAGKKGDEALNAEGEDLVGIVQGLIYSDGYIGSFYDD